MRSRAATIKIGSPIDVYKAYLPGVPKVTSETMINIASGILRLVSCNISSAQGFDCSVLASTQKKLNGLLPHQCIG